MAGTRPTADMLTGRIMRVIEAVVDAGEPVGPRGLARTTGMDRSAVGRILQQLTQLDVLARHTDGYISGPRLYAIGRLLGARDSLPNAVRPILDGLVRRFDETCYVCAFHGASAVFIHEEQSSHPLRFVVELGKPVPLHAGAAGRAILAGLSKVVVDELLDELELDQLTANTITSKRRLRTEAAADRVRGYSISIGERVEGGVSVASPFFDERETCQGSVVFTAPISRVGESEFAEIGASVRDAGRILSLRLGSSAMWYR